MAGRNFLFVPGPTNVPDRVLRAMAVPMEDHRSPLFPELTRACLTGLKPVFKTTTGTPILFPSSGTGCWEAALTNCLNPADKVLAARFGQFSHLWVDMCQRLGFEVEILETPWGEARCRTIPGRPGRRQTTSHQGGVGVPKRDSDGCDERCGRGAPGDGQRQAPCSAVR